MFYSSAVRRPDFHSVDEFRYLYGVDLIELRTLFYDCKMCCDQIGKVPFLSQILAIRLRDLFDHKEL